MKYKLFKKFFFSLALSYLLLYNGFDTLIETNISEGLIEYSTARFGQIYVPWFISWIQIIIGGVFFYWIVREIIKMIKAEQSENAINKKCLIKDIIIFFIFSIILTIVLAILAMVSSYFFRDIFYL